MVDIDPCHVPVYLSAFHLRRRINRVPSRGRIICRTSVTTSGRINSWTHPRADFWTDCWANPTPEIEPEIVDLGNGARLLLSGFPENIALDANLESEFKDNTPPTKNFDHLHTDTVMVTITKGSEFVALDNGVVELCFTTTEPNTALGDPKPYYWDTTKSPLVDGRGLRISEKQKEPEYMIGTMVQNSGGYAIVAW